MSNTDYKAKYLKYKKKYLDLKLSIDGGSLTDALSEKKKYLAVLKEEEYKNNPPISVPNYQPDPKINKDGFKVIENENELLSLFPGKQIQKINVKPVPRASNKNIEFSYFEGPVAIGGEKRSVIELDEVEFSIYIKTGFTLKQKKEHDLINKTKAYEECLKKYKHQGKNQMYAMRMCERAKP